MPNEEASEATIAEEEFVLTDKVETLMEEGSDAEAVALLEGEQPADVAEVLMRVDDDVCARLFPAFDPHFAGEVLDDLNRENVWMLMERVPEAAARAAEVMEPDELADVLGELGVDERRTMLQQLPSDTVATVRPLLAHRADTAGGIMTPEFVLLPESLTAAEAVHRTQRSRESETIAHLFVCDEENCLLGHLPLHRLVFAREGRKLSELYDEEVVTVQPETDQEEVVRLATRYGLDVVPVVNEDDELRGVITVDDILEAEREEVDEDIYRLAGTGETDPVHATTFRSITLRLPWLLITLFGGLCIAFLVSRFEGTLGSVEVAFFIPLIPLMGGNVAIQASAIVVRGLAVGDIRSGGVGQFAAKQWGVTLLLALLCGSAAAAIAAFLLSVSPMLPLVVGTAIMAAITVAGTLGTLLPLAFDGIGLDPAVSAGPFVTILNDLTCIFIYLFLCTVVL